MIVRGMDVVGSSEERDRNARNEKKIERNALPRQVRTNWNFFLSINST